MGQLTVPPRSGLPAVPRRSAALDRIRQARPPAVQQSTADLRRAALDTGRPRLLLAVDATASREPAWAAARATTDALFAAVPDGLDVGLAVHGGSEVHTWVEPVAEAARLRDRAAAVTCRAGRTRLVEVLDRARTIERLKVVVYAGDVFEEELAQALEAAKALRLRGCRVVILHDTADLLACHAGSAFSAIADAGGGCVLPFEAGSLPRLREMLEALAVLAAGGVRLLRERQRALPGARLLLEHLGESG